MSRPALKSRSASNSGAPRASLPRMFLAPFARLLRRLAPLGVPTTLPTSLTPLLLSVSAALQRLDLSFDPSKTISKLRTHQLALKTSLPYAFLGCCVLYDLYMRTDSFLVKLLIPAFYFLIVFLPITSQLFWPATPILVWALTFFSARFIPAAHRPSIHVALLPALESVLYGANISDLQTRYTNPILDVIAWLPYGVLHFSLPVIVALILWVLGPRGSAQYWGKAFGWMNLIGVITQVIFPCAAPCRFSLVGQVLMALGYEIIRGLTPADYSMPGSPGGLLRIDRVFHSSTYTNAFGSAPLVFGAFPSLHSGCAVMEALFLSHFFPKLKPLYWGYVGILWWATMYLSHHYLIDLTGGACLSVIVFYATMPAVFKDVDQIDWTAINNVDGYELVNGGQHGTTGRDMDLDEEIRKLEEHEHEDEELDEERRDEESAIDTAKDKGKQKRSVSWGETKVMGEEEENSGDVGEQGSR